MNKKGFTSVPEEKYYDLYTSGSSTTTHERGKLGDATKETLVTFGSTSGGWYNDYAYFGTSGAMWFIRGFPSGDMVGIFSYLTNTGVSPSGSRAIIS